MRIEDLCNEASPTCGVRVLVVMVVLALAVLVTMVSGVKRQWW